MDKQLESYKLPDDFVGAKLESFNLNQDIRKMVAGHTFHEGSAAVSSALCQLICEHIEPEKRDDFIIGLMKTFYTCFDQYDTLKKALKR